jgi:C-terminal processing protease CtpA/Prc
LLSFFQVIKGKAAALAKNLKVGDRIISANGVYLVGRSHDEVIQAMLTKTPDNVVTLELIADKSPLHNPELRKKIVVKRKMVDGRLEGIGLKIHSAAQDFGVALGARISEVTPHPTKMWTIL